MERSSEVVIYNYFRTSKKLVKENIKINYPQIIHKKWKQEIKKDKKINKKKIKEKV